MGDVGSGVWGVGCRVWGVGCGEKKAVSWLLTPNSYPLS